MKRSVVHPTHVTPSGCVNAELLERLFRNARQDHFTASRRQAVLMSLCAELRHTWERYEKVR